MRKYRRRIYKLEKQRREVLRSYRQICKIVYFTEVLGQEIPAQGDKDLVNNTADRLYSIPLDRMVGGNIPE